MYRSNNTTADAKSAKTTASAKSAFAALAAAVLSLGALASVSAPAARADAVGGPYRMFYTIPANSWVSYNITYHGGELAEAWADGYGNDVDMEVYDPYGNLIEWDRLDDDEPYCEWTPGRTRTYRIVIKNCEPYAVRARINTN